MSRQEALMTRFAGYMLPRKATASGLSAPLEATRLPISPLPSVEDRLNQAQELATVHIPVLTAAGSSTIGGHLSVAHDAMMQAFIGETESSGISAKGLDVFDWIVDQELQRAIVSASSMPRIVVRTETGSKLLHNKAVQKLRGGMKFLTFLAEPVKALIQDIDSAKPVVVFHYSVAKPLLEAGYKVVIAVTDPSAELTHKGYFEFLQKHPEWSDRVWYATMDQETSVWLAKKGIAVDKIRTVGAFVSPSLVAAGDKKIQESAARWSIDNPNREPIRISIFSGGLGTNFFEIQEILSELSAWIKSGKVELSVFLGTNMDLAKRLQKQLSKLGLHDAQCTVNIVSGTDKEELNKSAQRMLISADFVCSKPSGDRAYEACAAGCPLLSLFALHPHEEKIFQMLQEQGMAVKCDTRHMKRQIDKLITSGENIRMMQSCRSEHARVGLHGTSNLLAFYREIAQI